MYGDIGYKNYKDISLDRLVTYVVYLIIEEKREATFENIVAKCFELFPRKFALIGYSHWPDSARVNKAWLRCRTDFKYIKGTVKSGFKLTSKGYEVVQEVQRILKPTNMKYQSIKKHIKDERSREEYFINRIKANSLFAKYMNKEKDLVITEFDFCDLLFCTLESTLETRRKNLSLLKDYAKTLNDDSVYEFLSYCEKNLQSYLFDIKNGGVNQKYKGGMFKSKRKK